MILGLILMAIKKEPFAAAISVYLLINIYLISSWWDWGFGGSFGMRALVQSYALLAIPLGYFIFYLSKLKATKIKLGSLIITFSFFIFFSIVNVHQTWLSKHTLFHWDGMTKEAYRYTFLKTTFNPSERAYLESLFKFPDYEAMRRGERDEK
jgi:hypothetical protein